MTSLIERAERQLREAIDKARAGGFRLTAGEWGVEFAPWRGFFVDAGAGCGCALAAWALVKQPLVPAPQWPGDDRLDRDWVPLRLGAAVSDEFGWSTSAFRAFTDAWDGDVDPELAEAHPEVVDLAQRLVDDYLLRDQQRGAA